jgi:hypothetical protein
MNAVGMQIEENDQEIEYTKAGEERTAEAKLEEEREKVLQTAFLESLNFEELRNQDLALEKDLLKRKLEKRESFLRKFMNCTENGEREFLWQQAQHEVLLLTEMRVQEESDADFYDYDLTSAVWSEKCSDLYCLGPNYYMEDRAFFFEQRNSAPEEARKKIEKVSLKSLFWRFALFVKFSSRPNLINRFLKIGRMHSRGRQAR